MKAMEAVVAAEPSQALYLQSIKTYPSPALRSLSGREYKFLIDPAKTKASVDEAFSDIWSQVKAGAARHGFEVTERKGNPLKVERSTREYFDVTDQALWRKGYIIRVTDRRDDGTSSATAGVTVKSVGDDAVRTLAAPLAVAGIRKVKAAAEENVGFAPGGELRGAVEKGVSFSVALDSHAELPLGDFGRYVPELLSLGLPADSVLAGTKAFTYRVRPGKVALPGIGSSVISIEAWSAAAGGAPYLYEVSFGYGGIDFYAAGETHAAAERFMTLVIGGELGGLGGPESGKWAGSKVRKLMNRPLSLK